MLEGEGIRPGTVEADGWEPVYKTSHLSSLHTDSTRDRFTEESLNRIELQAKKQSETN